MSRRLELDDLWRIPHAYDARRSPYGESVAYVVRTPDRGTDGYVRRIWLADVASGESRTFTAGPYDDAPRWSPDGSALAFVSTRDGGTPQLWLIPTGGGEPRRLTELPYGVAGAPVWSPCGQQIAVLGTSRDAPADGTPPPVVVDRMPYKRDGLGFLPPGHGVAVYVVDAATGSSHPVTGGGCAVSPAWSPDGTRIAYACQGEDATAPVYVVDAAGGVPVRVTDDDLTHSCVVWSPDGSALVTVAADPRYAGPGRLYTVPATGGSPRELLPGFDLTVTLGRVGPRGDGGPAYTRDGRLLFVACDRSRDHLYEVTGSGEPRKLIGGEHRLVKGFSVTDAGLAYVEATPASTGEVAVAGLDGTGQRTLTSVFADALPGVELIAPESRPFTAPDSVPVHGWLLRGDAAGPAPLLLDIHGGPHDSWPPAFEGAELYQQVLAARGWHVLKLNMRGSDGYGSAFWNALVERWGIADEGDYHAALDALVADGTADPARLAVGGYSYGGFATCWLTARTDRFAAAVAGGMICNLVSMSGTSDLGTLAARLSVGAEPYYAQLDLLARRSPLAHAERVRTPTLILQGEAEQRAPLEQAEQWYAALHANGTPARLVVYPGGGHGVIDDGPPSHRYDFHARYVAWLTEHVRPSKVAAGLHPAADAPGGAADASSLHGEADHTYSARAV